MNKKLLWAMAVSIALTACSKNADDNEAVDARQPLKLTEVEAVGGADSSAKAEPAAAAPPKPAAVKKPVAAMTTPATQTAAGVLYQTDQQGRKVLEKMPNLSKVKDVRRKKRQFFNTLRPIIQQENARVAKQRMEVLRLKRDYEAGNVGQLELAFLGSLALEYREPDFDPADKAAWTRLLERIDEVPITMALAQAANESAWGTSRFAQQGNNLFGQWCFSKGCGIVPKRRNSGASHEVARFDTVNEGVRSYIRNLNTTGVYDKFRRLRATARKENRRLSGRELIQGLEKYSERGNHYIQEIRAMIRVNRDFMIAGSPPASG